MLEKIKSVDSRVLKGAGTVFGALLGAALTYLLVELPDPELVELIDDEDQAEVVPDQE